MKTTTVRASLIVLLLCVLPPAAQAIPIELTFAGTVSSVYDPFGLVGSLVPIGAPVVASVGYDTMTTDLDSADPTRGTYLSPGWLALKINDLRFRYESSVWGVQVDILHHGNDDQELFQAMVSGPGNGVFGRPTSWPASLPLSSMYQMLLLLGQASLPYTLLSSDALPTSLDLALADFAFGQVSTFDSDSVSYTIGFQLTSMRAPEPIPEPGTFALLGSGLALALSRYRASRAHRDAHRAEGTRPHS